MTYRQDLDTLLEELEVTPSGVLDENIVKALRALYARIEAIEAG